MTDAARPGDLSTDRAIDLPTGPGAGTRPPLRVGALTRKSFAALFSGFAIFAGTGIALLAARVVVTFLLVRGFNAAGLDYMLQRSLQARAAPGAASVAASAVGILLFVLASAFTHLVLLDLALKRQAGTPARVADALRAGLRFLAPMSAVYVAVWFLVTLGFSALVVPGLWLLGVYAVVSAVILAEDRPRGAMRRTRRLTKGYRWPLVGFILIVYLFAAALGILAFGAGKLAVTVLGAGIATTLAALAVDSVVEGLTAALYAVAVAQAYRRLRAVKEGGGDLAAVFA